MIRIIFIFSFLLINLSLFGQTNDVVDVSDVSIDSTGLLKWTTSFTGSNCEGLAVQWRFGKWVIIDEPFKYNFISGGTKTKVTDSLRVKFFNGLNRYKIMIRVPQQISSKEVSLTNKDASDDLNVLKVDKEIANDTEGPYKILDSKNKTVLKGTLKGGKKINVSRLKPGKYTLVGTKGNTREFIKN